VGPPLRRVKPDDKDTAKRIDRGRSLTSTEEETDEEHSPRRGLNLDEWVSAGAQRLCGTPRRRGTPRLMRTGRERSAYLGTPSGERFTSTRGVKAPAD
jgi:hypothetical protein